LFGCRSRAISRQFLRAKHTESTTSAVVAKQKINDHTSWLCSAAGVSGVVVAGLAAAAVLSWLCVFAKQVAKKKLTTPINRRAEGEENASMHNTTFGQDDIPASCSLDLRP
jgi:hypothetical protein